MTQDEQEAVAWIDNSGHPKHISYRQSVAEKKLYGDLRPLYAQPQPKREPLTDEQIKAIAQEHIAVGTRSFEEFARRIETAHGIKGEI